MMLKLRQQSGGLELKRVLGSSSNSATLLLESRKGARGLGIDGIVGPRTWAALQVPTSVATRPEPAAVGGAPPPAPLDEAPLDEAPLDEAPWMTIARGQKGQREIPGPRHNPQILKYHATTTLRASADEVPWCASFVGWCLQEAGLASSRSAAAASYAFWGEPVAAVAGSVIVIYNAAVANSSLTASGNHVGFLVKATTGAFEILGGNQNNEVNVSRFLRSAWSLRGCRWALAPST
jgi:uncharacterized protein (TIGR02594 family)